MGIQPQPHANFVRYGGYLRTRVILVLIDIELPHNELKRGQWSLIAINSLFINLEQNSWWSNRGDY